MLNIVFNSLLYFLGLLLAGFVNNANGQLINCNATTPPPPNTLCLAPNSDCIAGSTRSNGFNDSTLIQYMLALHNTFRAKVAAGGESRGAPGPQPESKCMAKIVWDPNLATAAQNLADQCAFASDTNANRNIYNGTDNYVGQNFYGFIDPATTPPSLPSDYNERLYSQQAFASWTSEITSLSNRAVSNYTFNPAVGHVVQILWGRTIKMGCGMRRSLLRDGSRRYGLYLICNYWPGGNRSNQPVYVPITSNSVACGPNCNNSNNATNTFNNTTLNGFLCDSGLCP